MILPETHAMLISIREKWAVHTNTGKTLFVEREYDDDTQRWSYSPVSSMEDDTLVKCIKIIERQPEAHGHWKEAGLDKRTHELIRENMVPDHVAPEDVTLFIGCQDEPPEPEYMPDVEVPCGE